ncbi:glycosyltransferase [Natronomonas gomsonensis]|uniref:glycosyltransferase n=1 Tax=Natronomonas gomsonensis TaxID=1046043 RepID=UPI0020CA2C37|nr:glycosyltransferase [Natronomonas gomsonensis]MCY4730114.1 glycosyltransferase [Natronomonas gomsonensis]
MQTVAVFTDTYLPTVNGVTYTIETWRDYWCARGGRMPVVYPGSDGYRPAPDEHPVSSLPFPFYPGFRLGRPRIPSAISEADPDVVHTHTPFALGLAGRRLATRADLPLVASYHTPASEYAEYISDHLSGPLRRIAERYERWFFRQADAVVVPSRAAAAQVPDGGTPVHVVSNGVDTDLFQPSSEAAVAAFRDRHDIPEGPLVGYTGRHGHEKRLEELLTATRGIEATLVVGGDGPARSELERAAAARDDVVFLGFLDRSELPTFYTALDAFGFPSPVETQGLVALEAIACGTPVVAADGAALSETVVDGETGYHFEPGNVDGLTAAIRRALADRQRLSERCLSRRDALSVERSIDALENVYDTVVNSDARRLVR